MTLKFWIAQNIQNITNRKNGLCDFVRFNKVTWDKTLQFVIKELVLYIKSLQRQYLSVL